MEKRLMPGDIEDKNTESLRLAESLTGLGYFEKNWQTGEGHWSEGFYRLLGEYPEEIDCTYTEFMKYVHPDDAERVAEHIRNTLKTRTNMDIEFRIIQVNGNVIDIHGRGTNIYDNSGKPLKTIGSFLDITDTKKAEEKLRESEEKFRTLAENTPGLLYRVFLKENSRMEFFNDNILSQMTGYTSDELSRGEICSIESMIVNEDKDKVLKTVKKAIIQKKPFEVEYIIKNKNNEVRNYNERGTPIYGKDGTPIFIDGIIFDVTEQKINENKLKENEEKYRALFEREGNGIFIYDLDTMEILDANSAMTKTYGYKLDELIGMNCLELSAEVEKSRKAGSSINEKGRFNVMLRWHKKKDGSVFPLELDGYTVELNRKTVGVAVIKDITDRKQTENALLENQKRYEKAQKMGHVGNWEYDPATTFFWASDEAKRIYGFDVEIKDLSTEKVERCIPERESVHQALVDLLEHNKPYDLVFDIITCDKGIRRTIHSVAEVERDILGNPIKVTGVISDITEKRKLENYLRKSQKLESLGILAGGIAHDFNNILSAIFGYTEMAMLKTSEQKTSDYLNKSLKNIERAQALTRQLLTFAKGGIPVKKVEKLYPFIKETVNFALSGSSVSSEFNIQENLWLCNFDKNQIGQVIDNLTINAKQAMSNGGTIEVSAENSTILENDHPVLEQGEYVKVSIKDTGIGIPKEFLQKIFDPYYSTKPKGHGLGLATCYSIIKKHGGYIEVKSEPGKGSIFSVFLPATTEPIDNREDTEKYQHKGKGTFVVMDDEESIRDIIREMLESFGYEVVLKTNGCETIDYLKEKSEENFEIAGMIFDLTIPGGIGGKEAVKEVKKLFPEVPVFVTSGYSEDPIVSNPENYGFNASIRKPFMISDISEMLEKHMKKSSN